MNTEKTIKEPTGEREDIGMTLSVHVCTIPCQEEFYMGVDASYEAYQIAIPMELLPKGLLKILQDENPNKRIINIALIKE